MAPLRNLRHELFVRELIRNGGVATDAYRVIASKYPVRGVNNPDCYKVIACQVRARPEVRQREWELREKMAKKADITMEKILTDYQEALNLAKQQAKPNEIVNAATAQAKLVGLLRDRVEAGNVGDFDGMENMSDIIAKVGEELGPEAALVLSKALGVDSDESGLASGPPDPEEAEGLIDQPPPSDSVN